MSGEFPVKQSKKWLRRRRSAAWLSPWMARTCINFSKHMEKLCKVTAFGVFSSRKYLLAPSPHSAVCDGHSNPFFLQQNTFCIGWGWKYTQSRDPVLNPWGWSSVWGFQFSNQTGWLLGQSSAEWGFPVLFCWWDPAFLPLPGQENPRVAPRMGLHPWDVWKHLSGV